MLVNYRIVLSFLFILGSATEMTAQNSLQYLREALGERVVAIGQSALASRRDTAHQALLLDSLDYLTDSLASDLAIAHRAEIRLRVGLNYSEKEAALTEAKKVLSLYARAADPYGEGRLYNLLGNIYYRNDDLEGTFRMAEKQLDAARQGADNGEIARAYGNLGLTSKKLGNLAQAKRYYLRSNKYAEAAADLGTMVRNLNNISNLHSGHDSLQIDTALRYNTEAIALMGRMTKQDTYLKGALYEARAKAFARADRFDSTLVNARRSYEAYKLSTYKSSVFRSTQYLARVHNGLGQPARARHYLDEAVAMHRQNEKLDPTWLYLEQGRYWQQRGNADSTAYYFQLYASKVEDKAEKRQEQRVAALETEFRTNEQRAEIQKLQVEDQLNQQRLRLQRYALLGTLIGLSFLAFLAYRLFRQRRRIEEQKGVIQGALKEKELLMKEIHHRVKNNLQMVSSLLSLQSRYLNDEGAVAALRMGNSRVRSMALIHQRLYLEDEVRTSISVREYLERLAEELIGRREDIRLTTSIVDAQLDIDTLVPLGLIVNELLTNSVKYAVGEAGRTANLLLGLYREAGGYRLVVEDDGPGFRQDPTLDPQSFGWLLVLNLVHQLDGEVDTAGGEGATVSITFQAA